MGLTRTVASTSRAAWGKVQGHGHVGVVVLVDLVGCGGLHPREGAVRTKKSMALPPSLLVPLQVWALWSDQTEPPRALNAPPTPKIDIRWARRGGGSGPALCGRQC